MRPALLGRRSAQDLVTVGSGGVVIAAASTTGTWPYLVLAAIALPVGAAVLRRPQLGLLIAAAAIPYDGLLNVVDLPPLASGWKEALLLGTFVASALHPARRPLRGPGAPPVPRWAATWGALVLFAVGSGLVVGGAAGAFGVKVWCFWSITLVVQRLTPLTARDRDRLVTVLMVNGAITAAFGIFQQAIGDARLASYGWEYGTDIRTTGRFLRSFSTFDGGPFPFAYFLAVVLVVGAAVALADPGRRRNQWFFASTPLLVAGLLCTLTRGTWVLALVGLGYLAVTRHRRLLLAVPLALSTLVLVPADVASSAFSSSSTIERTSVWEQTGAVAVRYPLGVGIGSAGGASQRAARSEGLDTSDVVETDNMYLLAFYEFGAPGLALFLLLVSGWFGGTRAAERLIGPDGALAAGTSAVLAGAVAAFFFASLLQIFPFEAYLWLLLGAVHGATTDVAAADP